MAAEDQERYDEEQASSGGPPSSGGSARMIQGMLWGVCITVIVGGVLLWANRKSTSPAPAATAGSTTVAGEPGATQNPADVARAHQASDADLPATAAAEIALLRSRLDADPTDIAARKQLALRLLENQHFVDAFDQAKAILQTNPNDPDGLYVEGVVRTAMGQVDTAIDLLDRVLAQHPDHVLALIAKGRALAGMGRLSEAVETWKKGLAAAGGHNSQIERLLAEAKQEMSASGNVPAAPASGVPAAGSVSPPATSTAPSGGTTTGLGYTARIELAPGARTPPNGVLFVFVKSASAGAPAAVKRIADPHFPLEVKLGSSDSMMGQPLPASGDLVVRLDSDGDAVSRSPEDLEATVNASQGKPVTVTLRKSAG